ncbi:transcriptional repressor [Clostridium tyrobutyricum]|uniref:Zinc uptake regulation protein ZUR n=1 Tax=Clostridium tyrobutyricum DIVETGP TaxID=1408889 RepID=W6NBH3_CLOTY|nr:Fur family transcriptional regulator [Clostridium tyrobutyricum]AND85804.1 ferric uptake regulator [Clostridium tyrobutyricum]ANP70320.1 transcriptional repressor [Clostridium tyrobutyricum]MBV4434763.1 transcriptional repressor [Clostridium tyrobutyricum]QNB68045.1 transcriptional repressor [Clostridium tyrobutyricum]CDL92914.1 Zinc uptake regulation protein ZUR [Clostridium tyrobutyricum DIVETGP]
MDNLTGIFKDKKLKLTPQRIAVYKYLKSTNEHPSAETIYKSLLSDYPTMSLATVYKALKTLVEVDLIQEINVGEGNFRYDGNTAVHSHIQCLECGRVDDVTGICFFDLNDKIKDKVDYKVMSNQVYFYGICHDCQNKLNN